MKEKILQLRKEGKSYREIQKETGCSKGTIAYHCGKGQKEKTRNRVRTMREKNSLIHKTDWFKHGRRAKKGITNKSQKFQLRTTYVDNKHTHKTMSETTMEFNHHDVLKKIGKSPQCYLTGRKINLEEPSSYNLDHIIPTGKGGDNSIENLGITCKEANMAKHDMVLEEFLQLCKEVLEHNGYEVNKIG